MSWQYDTVQRVLVAAPPSNNDIISNAANLSDLDILRARVSELETTQTTIATEITTISTAVSATTTASNQFQDTIFTTDEAAAVVDFAAATNTVINVSGTPVGPTTLILDLSAAGIATGLAPSFQTGYLQVIWPTSLGITHTVQIAVS